MKKGIILLFVLMFTVSMVFADGVKPVHGPTVLIPQAEIGGRAIGDDCTEPIVISIPADLPYEDLAQTTCGRGNSYSDTALGYYDGGEDIIYRIDATSDIYIDLTLNPDVTTYVGMLIADDCPDVGNAIDWVSVGYLGGILTLEGIELLAGNSYYVMADTWPDPDCIPAFDLNIVEGEPPPPPPENLTCETAEAIAEVVDFAWDTTYATASGFGTYISSPDIWYVYTATGDGMLKVDICGSSFDTKLAAWGECDDTTLIDSNDDACYGERAVQSELDEFPIVTGEDYFIQVGGYSSNSGAGDLTIVFTPTTTTVDYQVRLYDSYGDGWDTSSIDLAVNGTVLLDDITLVDGFGPEAFIFAVADDDEVVITFTAGSWPEENTYDIVNDEDVVIYTSPAPPEDSYSFIVGAVAPPNVFFSEYIEGSSNNKALEIYNASDQTVDLTQFAFPNSNNDPTVPGQYDYWNTFDAGASVAPGDVYVIAHPSADPIILAEADMLHSYLSNGDDGFGLVFGTETSFVVVDMIGDWMGDPGDGWEVAGIADATKDHTLVRKEAVTQGNSDWTVSAGTNEYNSEWIVYDQDDFSFIGDHNQAGIITGIVTIDGFGDLENTMISVGIFATNADEAGAYSLQVPPGTHDVKAELSGYDELILTDIVVVDEETTENVDFALTVIPETLWPPVNLTAEIDASDVNVAWTAPTQYGWNGYYQGAASLGWAGPERATFFDVTDFGFSYPMELSQLSHGFYHHPVYPWGDDTTFTFKIYDADGSTVLYESDVITALPQWDETLLVLDTPITVTDNFWVSVVPTGASGHPSSLFSGATTNLHGYAGEPGAWGEPSYDFSTLVYIMGDEGDELLTYNAVRRETANSTQSSRKVKRTNCVKIDEFAPIDNSRDLLSFNVFRDDVLLNTEPVDDVTYVDLAVPAGEHIYHATAIWNFGESVASNTATVDLSFGDLSGLVTDGTDPIVGAIVTAGTYSVATEADGTYLIEDMLVGIYEVGCSSAGYETAIPVSAEITDGGNTVVDFALEEVSGNISFIDNFESGGDNWVFEGTWGLSEEGANSPTHCMTESPNVLYGANLDISSTLATPWDLSAVFGAELSFWYKSDIETAFDYMYLEISTDGTEWANLATYDEEDGEWQQTAIPIGGFVGVGYETVSIRFRFESDSGYETVGMLIDDVILTTYDDDTFPPFIAHTGPEFYEGTADDYVFDATIIDISGVAEANVIYTVDEGDPITVPFTSVVGDVYTFTIPAQEAGAQVDYAIEAIDTVAEPNTGLLEGFVYIAGTPFIYDNGFVDFYTVFNEGTGAAELIINPAGNQLNLAYALIRNYTDQSGQDNDDFEFHVWADNNGLPGVDLITPFVVTPEASYTNTSAMTRVDLRPYADDLNDIQGNFFIGFLVNQAGPEGKVHCTTTQPSNYTNSFTFDGAAWTFWSGTDLHFRAVAELIVLTTGTVEGVVTDADTGNPIVGAEVTIGTAIGITLADGSYSIVADPGTQDVVCEIVDYEVFNGSVEVLENETVIYDIELDMILWAPQNLTYQFNEPNVLLEWEAPVPPSGGDIEELIYDDGISTGAYSYVGYSMGTQMSPSEACQILTLKIHTSDGTNFNAEVWGWDAGAPTEDLYYQENVDAVLDDWVIVDVSGESLMFDGDFVVTFGSLNGDTYMSYDGGLNNGRSWDHADAGGWATWSEAYLVRAIVQYADGRIAEISPTPIKTNNVIGRTIETGEKISIDVADHNVDASREFAGYNIYRNGDVIGSSPLEFYLDIAPPAGTYTYYVTAVYEDPDGESEATNEVIVEVTSGDDILKPTATKLTGNYPNPFNPTTTISFSLKEAGHVSINIYNMRGQLVKTLINTELDRNFHNIVWDGKDNSGKNTSSGVYFYKMKAQNYNSTKKMLLMK